MKREVSLCGIPYTVESREGLTIFREAHGIAGCTASIFFEKDQLHYVRTESSSSKGVPFSHIAEAHKIMETLAGPNHFRSIQEKEEFDRQIWWKQFWDKFRHPIKAVRWWLMLRGLKPRKLHPWCVECGKDLVKPAESDMCSRCYDWWERNPPPTSLS